MLCHYVKPILSFTKSDVGVTVLGVVFAIVFFIMGLPLWAVLAVSALVTSASAFVHNVEFLCLELLIRAQRFERLTAVDNVIANLSLVMIAYVTCLLAILLHFGLLVFFPAQVLLAFTFVVLLVFASVLLLIANAAHFACVSALKSLLLIGCGQTLGRSNSGSSEMSKQIGTIARLILAVGGCWLQRTICMLATHLL